MAGSSKSESPPPWESDPVPEADGSVFDRATAVPEFTDEDTTAEAVALLSEPAPPPDEPPTKPQARIGDSWKVAKPSSFPPPTPRVFTLPRLALDAEDPHASPLGLADLHAEGEVLTAPPAMAAPSDSVPPLPSLDEATSEMQGRYEVGDFSGALAAAERVLQLDPDDVQANRYAENCREVLTQMFSARLAPLERTVTVAVSPEQIRWLSLDHKSGFLLSLVDGSSSIEELLDISGMPRLDALRILSTLAQQKVIALT